MSAHVEVTVAFPPKLELHCPSLTVVNGSMEITLVSWGALGLNVDWMIAKNDVQVAKGEGKTLHQIHQAHYVTYAQHD